MQGREALLKLCRAACIHQLRYRAAQQRFRAIAESFRSERVQRCKTAFHGACENKAERVLNHLTIACLTRHQRHFDLPLFGYILAADDEVLDLAIGALEWTKGPTDAPGIWIGSLCCAAAGAPWCFMRTGVLACSRIAKFTRDPIAIGGLDDLINEGASDGLAKR